MYLFGACVKEEKKKVVGEWKVRENKGKWNKKMECQFICENNKQVLLLVS